MGNGKSKMENENMRRCDESSRKTEGERQVQGSQGEGRLASDDENEIEHQLNNGSQLKLEINRDGKFQVGFFLNIE